MLIIPFDRKLDWSRPPLVTFVLLALNVFVFFAFQTGDNAGFSRAIGYYSQSGLAAVELPLYRDYLERQYRMDWPPEIQDNPVIATERLVYELQFDLEFRRLLSDGQIIKPKQEGFSSWQEHRAEFEALWNEVFTLRHALTTSEIRPSALFSHMFLHGDLAHLLGNMLFLVSVGFLVEGALSRGVYLGAYLLSGLGAAGLYLVLSPASLVPLVGASGAISGLMGMYAVLFGTRRISFFYFVGVYFDYVKAPAYLLLVLWLGWEIAQYVLFSDGSNVAYAAHIGGLCAGAVIGLMLGRRKGQVDIDYLDAGERVQSFEQRLAGARQHLRSLDFARALPQLEALWREQPDNVEILRELHKAAKTIPDAPIYHETAGAVLALPARDPETEKWVLDCFRTYREKARPQPRLPSRVIPALADRFLTMRALDEAAFLIRIMASRSQKFPQTRKALARLAHLLLNSDRKEDARKYFRLQVKLFPHTPDAEYAKLMLESKIPQRPGADDQASSQ